jgi:hypothetical protein
MISTNYYFDSKLNQFSEKDVIKIIDYFDPDNKHIKSVSVDTISKEMNFIYNTNNEIESFSWDNLTENFTYDKKGRIIESLFKSSNNSTVNRRIYHYNNIENIVQIETFKDDSLLYISQVEYELSNDSLVIKKFEIVDGNKIPTSE